MRAVAALAGAVLLLGPGAARADDVPGLEWEAAAGFDGRYVIGRWLPVRVLVDNRGSDLDVEVALHWGTAEYRQTLDLPSPSRKEVEFYVHGTGDRDELDVRLIARDGQELDRRTVVLSSVRPDEPLQLAIAGSPEDSGDVLAVPPGALPLSWRGFDGVASLTGDAGASLRPDQVAALARWRHTQFDGEPAGAGRQQTVAAAAGDRSVADRWVALAVYVAALGLSILLAPLFTRRAGALAGLPFLVVAVFLARSIADGLWATPAVHTSAIVGATSDGERPFTTIAMLTARARGRLRVRATAGTRVYPAIERPHVLRSAENGETTLEVAMAEGQGLSVIARGFTAAAIPCDTPPHCSVPADRVGLVLPGVAAAVTLAPEEAQ